MVTGLTRLASVLFLGAIYAANLWYLWAWPGATFLAFFLTCIEMATILVCVAAMAWVVQGFSE